MLAIKSNKIIISTLKSCQKEVKYKWRHFVIIITLAYFIVYVGKNQIIKSSNDQKNEEYGKFEI